MSYVVRSANGIEHHDDVLDAMPAARALAQSGVRNVRVFRCDPSGEVLLAFVKTEAARIATTLPDRAAYLRARADDHLRRARAQREYLRELGFFDLSIEDLEAEVRRER